MLNIIMISKNFEKMFEEAKKIRLKAYVPYSSFKVGVALLTENEKIKGNEAMKSNVIFLILGFEKSTLILY